MIPTQQTQQIMNGSGGVSGDLHLHVSSPKATALEITQAVRQTAIELRWRGVL